jgi:hypothetical protein
MIEFAHWVPGRLRIRVPSVKHDAKAAAAARCAVLSITAVASVSINAATASLVVIYDPEQLPLAALWDELQRRLGPAIPSSAPARVDPMPAGTGAGWLAPVMQVALEAVVGRIVERSALALVRAVL